MKNETRRLTDDKNRDVSSRRLFAPRSRRLRLAGVLTVVALLAIGAALLFVEAPPTGFPEELYREPLPGVERQVLRRELIGLRNEFARRGDLAAVAEIHAALAREAVLSARAVYDAWMPIRNPDTKLFPQSNSRSQWNYRNTAADFFPFQWHTAIYTDAADLSLLHETLAAEAGNSGGLPLPRCVHSGRVIWWSTESPIPFFQKRGRVFGASEYVKDGLLSLYEGTADAHAYARMIELLDVILEKAEHDSPYGRIPSDLSEVNGEMLQTLTRVARVEPAARYEEILARIADAAVSAMLPANYGMPCAQFDYAEGVAESTEVPLRDHGNEIIPGLAEAFAFAVDHMAEERWRERAERWVGPLATMFEGCLTAGLRPDGLMASSFDARTGELLDERPNDNWGYVAVGVRLFAARAEEAGLLSPAHAKVLRTAVRELAESTARTDGLAWEGASHDGYADTIESALLVADRNPQNSRLLLDWVDDQMGLLLGKQQPSGFVSAGYLDGNFMRTALMYADLRSGSWMLKPWDPAVAAGYASDGERGVLSLSGRPGATYTLLHRGDQRGFPGAFAKPTPRLNAWPDWSEPAAMRFVSAEGEISDPALPSDAPPERWTFIMPADGTLNLSFQHVSTMGMRRAWERRVYEAPGDDGAGG